MPFLSFMAHSDRLIAKKIPIEHILASTRGGTGRLGQSSRAGTAQEGVNLEENASKTKDACNC